MPVALITGANRGIGLEHSRQFLAGGWDVHACARDPAAAAELQKLAEAHPGQLTLHALEVTDHAAVDALAAELRGRAIDVLLNNAGTYGPQGYPAGAVYQSLDNMDYAIWREILEVNLLAPFKVAVAFHDHVAASDMQLIVMMSSGLASIADNVGSSHAYRSSKAALNMITSGMARDWDDVTTIAMAPGWCRTELGGEDAPVETADSVRGQQALFPTLNRSDSGRFVDFEGRTQPW